MNLLDLNVSLSGESVVLRLCLDDDQHGIRSEFLQVLVNRDIVLVQLRTRVIPSHYLLLRSYLKRMDKIANFRVLRNLLLGN